MLASICQTVTATCCYPIFVGPLLLSAARNYLSDRYCYLLLGIICQTLQLPAASHYLSDRYSYLLLPIICQTVTLTCC